MISAGLDGKIRVWDFQKRALRLEMDVGSPITHMAHFRSGSLVAVSSDDLVIRVFDVLVGRLVRQFRGHSDRITCLEMSADSKWVLSSSMDGTLRVWDLPSARCLQVVRLGAPITAFSLSPDTCMLATSHSNRRGIYLWSNQLVFGNPAAIFHSEKPVDCRLPLATAAEFQTVAGTEDEEAEAGEGSDDDDSTYVAGSEDEDSDEEEVANTDVAERPDQRIAANGAPVVGL